MERIMHTLYNVFVLSQLSYNDIIEIQFFILNVLVQYIHKRRRTLVALNPALWVV